MTFCLTTVVDRPWDGYVQVEGGYFIMFFTTSTEFAMNQLKPTHTYSIHPYYNPVIKNTDDMTRDFTNKRFLRAYGSDGMYLRWVSDDPIYADPYFDAFADGYTRPDSLFEIISVADHTGTAAPLSHFLVKASNGRFILPGATDNTYDCSDSATPSPLNVTRIVPRIRFQSNAPLDSFYIRTARCSLLHLFPFMQVFGLHSVFTDASRWTMRLVPPPAGAPPTEYSTVNFFNVGSSKFLGVDVGGAFTTLPHTTAPGNVLNFRLIDSRQAFPTIYPGSNCLWVIYHPFSDRYLVCDPENPWHLHIIPTTHARFSYQFAFWEFQPATYTDVLSRTPGVNRPNGTLIGLG